MGTQNREENNEMDKLRSVETGRGGRMRRRKKKGIVLYRSKTGNDREQDQKNEKEGRKWRSCLVLKQEEREEEKKEEGHSKKQDWK